MKNYKFISLTIILIIICQQAISVGGWRTRGNFDINASQTSFTNWAAGGDNSVSGNSFFSYTANYKRNKMSWDNSIEMGIGFMRQGEEKFFKTDDRIALASKYGREASNNWYYSGLVGFRSQFAKGYKSISDDTKVSNFLAPGYLTLSVGMDYKPLDNLTILMSPLTGRTTFVLDTMLSNQGAFGVEKGKTVRNEFGGFIKIEYQVDIMENVSYRTNLELFSNYLDKPQNVNVNWDNYFSLKINNYLSASIHLSMIYDDDILISYDSTGDGINDKKGPKLQIRNIMGLGLSFRF